MPRPCGPCSDKRRIELDRRLLEKDLTGESFRRIAKDFGYSETALRRHKDNHIKADLVDVRAVMVEAREQALSEARDEVLEAIKAGEVEAVKAETREGMAARLENAVSFLDQLAMLRQKAADILETAEEAGDLKTALMGIKEARACIEVLARIEGKLSDSPQINLQQVNIYSSPEWDAVGLLLARILEPYPDLRAEVATGLQALQEGQNGA